MIPIWDINEVQKRVESVRSMIKKFLFLWGLDSSEDLFRLRRAVFLFSSVLDTDEIMKVFAVALANMDRQWTFLSGTDAEERIALCLVHLYLAHALLHDES